MLALKKSGGDDAEKSRLTLLDFADNAANSFLG